jgi:Sec-independent protein secretion pathway component TatC
LNSSRLRHERAHSRRRGYDRRDQGALDGHLIELRKRLVYSLLALFGSFIVCYAFARPIYAFLTQPLANALAGQPGRHLIYTALSRRFSLM